MAGSCSRVYGILIVSLVLTYFGSVVALEYAFNVLTAGSQRAVVASTLVIAALFSSLRLRVQFFIDSRSYRRKYDGRETLEEFGAKLRDEMDLGRLREGLIEAVQETMQPANLSLWLREPEGMVRL